MPAPVELSVFGTRLLVETEGLAAGQRSEVASLWTRCEVNAARRATSIRVAMPRAESWEASLELLSSAVTIAAIESRRGKLVMLHAGAVAHEDGRVITFVGPSGRGKTTASIALGRWYGYVSDETTAVTFDQQVLPYPKPLSVVTPGATAKRQVGPDSLGLLAVQGAPLVLEHIVLLDRQLDGPIEPAIERVGASEALAEIVPQLSYFTELDRPLERLLKMFDEVGGVLRLRYREAESLPDTVAALFSGESAAQRRNVAWRNVATAVHEAAPRGFRRAAVDEALEVDGCIALRHGNNVRVLDGIGPAIWTAAASWTRAERIFDAVIAEVGIPPGGHAGELVGRALMELVDSGVLLRAEPV